MHKLNLMHRNKSKYLAVELKLAEKWHCNLRRQTFYVLRVNVVETHPPFASDWPVMSREKEYPRDIISHVHK